MKITIAAFSLIGVIGIICSGQDASFNQLDKKGGLYYQKNSHALFTGDAIKLDLARIVLEKISIKKGLLDGVGIVVDDGGENIGEGIFKNGNGILHLYYNYDKTTILEETHYENNLRQGKSIRYYENGRPAEETFFDKDMLHGTDTIWRENGTIVFTKEWKNGELNGKWLEFYETGEKEGEGSFKNGKGRLIRWYKNGAIQEITSFKNSKEDGRSLSWHENGKKSSEASFKNGMVHGELIEWDKNGKIAKDEVYKNGFFCYSKLKK